jgi:hypothetical protein
MKSRVGPMSLLTSGLGTSLTTLVVLNQATPPPSAYPCRRRTARWTHEDPDSDLTMRPTALPKSSEQANRRAWPPFDDEGRRLTARRHVTRHSTPSREIPQNPFIRLDQQCSQRHPQPLPLPTCEITVYGQPGST